MTQGGRGSENGHFCVTSFKNAPFDEGNNLETRLNQVLFLTGACSHGRVNDLYVESIRHAPHVDVFLSKSCESWNHYEEGNCSDQIGPIKMGEGLTPNE